MTYAIEQLERIMRTNGGNLNLSGTKITSLPDNLTVGGAEPASARGFGGMHNPV